MTPLTATPPQLSLCSLIATLINGESFGAGAVSARFDRMLPKYEYSDLPRSGFIADVIPSAETIEIEQQARGMVVEDCPVVIAVECRCPDDETYRAAFQTLRNMAVYLQFYDLSESGFQGPTSNTIEDIPETVDEESRFAGYISLSYRAVTRP